MEQLWIWECHGISLGTFPTITAAQKSMDEAWTPSVKREWDEVEEGGVRKGALWIRWPGERWQMSGHRLYRDDTHSSASAQASARLVAA